jgi:hypothetical protein
VAAGTVPAGLGFVPLCYIIIDGAAAAAGINFIGSDPDTSSLNRPQQQTLRRVSFEFTYMPAFVWARKTQNKVRVARAGHVW